MIFLALVVIDLIFSLLTLGTRLKRCGDMYKSQKTKKQTRKEQYTDSETTFNTQASTTRYINSTTTNGRSPASVKAPQMARAFSPRPVVYSPPRNVSPNNYPVRRVQA